MAPTSCSWKFRRHWISTLGEYIVHKETSLVLIASSSAMVKVIDITELYRVASSVVKTYKDTISFSKVLPSLRVGEANRHNLGN